MFRTFINTAARPSWAKLTLTQVRLMSGFRDEIRNLAIIAHVDHGKTTMVDKLMNACSINTTERVMDSMALEQERGITIMSKVTAMNWKNVHLNIVDTPGHADFGGEVERVLGMVDGVVLIVDATDGPNTQTKFVTKKALERGLRPLVVINKVDRDTARVTEVEDEVFDLFVALEANDEQLDFPFIYASAREGWAVDDVNKEKRVNMAPLLDKIVSHVPPPKDLDGKFKMIATMMSYDNFLGRLLMGRVHQGKIKVGDSIKGISLDGKEQEVGKVLKIMAPLGIEKVEKQEAQAGDIVQIAGLPKTGVSDTVCAADVDDGPLPSTPIDPPTLNMTFSVNTSPLQGKSGSKITATVIQARLKKEIESNVSVSIDCNGEDTVVYGRGELQLGILIENMRREGFELSISSPRVVMKTDAKGNKLEPMEEVILDVDDGDAGKVIEKFGARKGEMLEMYSTNDGRTRMKWKMSSRGLVGYRATFTTDTRGSGVMNRIFLGYEPYVGAFSTLRKNGVLVSMDSGPATSYALSTLENRGTLFIKPQDIVYDGMIVGENSKDTDLDLNPVKCKELTNVRSAGKDENIKLTPPKQFSLEEAMGYIIDDELLEVTPAAIRMRKILLTSSERERAARDKKNGKKA